jgi:hypothetical protein
MFKNGFLPMLGGWLNQSNKFIEVVSFIDDKITEHNNKEALKNGRQ